MTLRVPAAIAVGLTLIILPVIIVQAQSEGEAETAPATEAVGEAAPDTPTGDEPTSPGTESVADAAPEAASAEPPPEVSAAPTQEEGSVLGEATTDPASLEVGSTDASASTSEPENPGDESVPPAVSEETASTTPPEFLTTDTASSTASSTEPVENLPVIPYEEPFVLQPAVTLHVNGSSITADIELENLTCKSCQKVLPAAQVKAYYTAWYPNDGQIKEVGDHVAEQAIEVSDVALWASRSMSWSATDIAPGRYYFVVVVDPEDAIGAYRMQRMEFTI